MLPPLVVAFAPPDKLTDEKLTLDRSSCKAGRMPSEAFFPVAPPSLTSLLPLTKAMLVPLGLVPAVRSHQAPASAAVKLDARMYLGRYFAVVKSRRYSFAPVTETSSRLVAIIASATLLNAPIETIVSKLVLIFEAL